MRCVPLRAPALAELTSSSDTDCRTTAKEALRDDSARLALRWRRRVGASIYLRV